MVHSGGLSVLLSLLALELPKGQEILVRPHLCGPSGGLAISYLAGISLAIEVASTEHVGADVGTIHLRAATLVVSNKGDQCLLQEAGIVTGICGKPHFQGRQAHTALPPTRVTRGLPPTHSLSCGPSLQSDTFVQ